MRNLDRSIPMKDHPFTVFLKGVLTQFAQKIPGSIPLAVRDLRSQFLPRIAKNHQNSPIAANMTSQRPRFRMCMHERRTNRE